MCVSDLYKLFYGHQKPLSITVKKDCRWLETNTLFTIRLLNNELSIYQIHCDRHKKLFWLWYWEASAGHRTFSVDQHTRCDNHSGLEWQWVSPKIYFMVIRAIFLNRCKENGQNVDFRKMVRGHSKQLSKKDFLTVILVGFCWQQNIFWRSDTHVVTICQVYNDQGCLPKFISWSYDQYFWTGTRKTVKM